MFSTNMACYDISSKVFTKAQSLFKLIDVAVCDTEKCSSTLQNKKRKMEVHFARLQRYEHRYEKSAIKPTQFISFIKTSLSKLIQDLILHGLVTSPGMNHLTGII